MSEKISKNVNGIHEVDVNDVIGVETSGHKYSWYNVTKKGLVTKKLEDSIEIKLPSGEYEIIESVHKYSPEDGDVVVSIVPISSISFIDAIKEEIAKEEDIAKEQDKKLSEMYDWQNIFRESVSLSGRFKKLLKIINMQD